MVLAFVLVLGPIFFIIKEYLSVSLDGARRSDHGFHRPHKRIGGPYPQAA